MRFFETSKIYSLNRIQYIRLRWIAIIGQLITINFVKYGLGFEFNHILSNTIIYLGAISNLVLIYYYKKKIWEYQLGECQTVPYDKKWKKNSPINS